MTVQRLRSGDQVLHPQYGFGVVEGLIRREQAEGATDYYGIRLSQGAVLSVPVARAESVGLRRLANGLDAIASILRSPAQALPDDTRQRAAALNARWHAPQPTALIEAVRDLLGYGRSRHLTPGDKKWLAGALERLSAEAALVDGMDLDAARSAVQREVDQLKRPSLSETR